MAASDPENVEAALCRFRTEHNNDRKARLKLVLDVGIKMFFVGSLWFVAVVLFVPDDFELVAVCGIPVAVMLCTSGFLIVSTSPVVDLDIDVYGNSRPKLQAILWIALLLASFNGLPHSQHFYPAWQIVICLGPCIIVCLWGLHSVLQRLRHGPFFTTALVMYLISLQLLFLLGEVFWVTSTMAKDCNGLLNNYILIGMILLFALPFVSFLCLQRHRHKVHSRRGWPPTLAFYYTAYWFLFVVGICELVQYFLNENLTNHCSWSPGLGGLTSGVAFVLPALVVTLVGRDTVFGFVVRLAHRFDRTASVGFKCDGFTFLLCLYDDSLHIQVGDTWWVQHDRNDNKYPLWDPRRNWTMGTVSAVEEEVFVVHVVDSEHRLPHASRSLTEEDILSLARGELRCIEWKSMSYELIASTTCGADNVDNSNALTRCLHEDELIDYFLSHSWHDSADAKWAKLLETATEFRRLKAREPTFWLDKVCFDRHHMADGLRALPVHIMACRQVLALCGTTYTCRLWCVWELYTCCAFIADDPIKERIKLIPLEGDDDRLIQSLKHVDLEDAHCYDPNEEMKMKAAIELGGGGKRFSAQIHNLAEVFSSNLESEVHPDVIGLMDVAV